MIYDCFIFYNELDILELRLNVLNKVVDKFVLVEATKSFNNNEKQLFYEKNKERFKQFSDKIIHIIVDDFPIFETAWHYENHQRNAIMRGLSNCASDDLVIISDVDEIPDPGVLQKVKIEKHEVVCLCLRLYYYYFNFIKITDPVWRTHSVKITKYSTFYGSLDERFVTYSNCLIKNLNLTVTPNKIRFYRDCRYIFNCGWHFSYMGGAEAISDKLKNFSHQELNDEKYTNVDNVIENLRDGINVCTGEKDFEVVNIDKSFPEYLRANIDKYSKHIINIENKKQCKINFIIALKTFEGCVKSNLGKIKYIIRRMH